MQGQKRRILKKKKRPRGRPRAPLPANAPPFAAKLHALAEARGGYRALAAPGLSESTLRSWVTRHDPSLAGIQTLAAATKTPVCYWADDAWPVGTPGTPPRHMIEFVEEHLAGGSQRYSTGETDDGRVGEGRGASFAAEGGPGATVSPGDGNGQGEARRLTDAEVYAHAKRLVDLVRQALDEGVSLEEVEATLARALRRHVS